GIEPEFQSSAGRIVHPFPLPVEVIRGEDDAVLDIRGAVLPTLRLHDDLTSPCGEGLRLWEISHGESYGADRPTLPYLRRGERQGRGGYGPSRSGEAEPRCTLAGYFERRLVHQHIAGRGIGFYFSNQRQARYRAVVVDDGQGRWRGACPS